MIILDCGCGTQCNNDLNVVKELIDRIKRIDNKKHEIVFKWQLFTKKTIPYLMPLEEEVFTFAYYYALQNGYKTTASFFDNWSFDIINNMNISFIKIACRESLYKYIPKINNKIFVSVDSIEVMEKIAKKYKDKDITYLYCIPVYPASTVSYESKFGDNIRFGLSDHTETRYLFDKYNPKIWEKHYILNHNTKDPYGDDFCFTPEDLKGIL